jgi:hypothetical protein
MPIKGLQAIMLVSPFVLTGNSGFIDDVLQTIGNRYKINFP